MERSQEVLEEMTEWLWYERGPLSGLRLELATRVEVYYILSNLRSHQ